MLDSPPPDLSARPNLLEGLIKSAADLIRAKLEERPLSPHVFDEISVAAKAIHRACTALDPVLDLPMQRGPVLAPATQIEGAGARTARELLEMFQKIATPKEPKMSRKDQMAAIVVAEKAGLTQDAERLRAELFDEDIESEEVEDDLLPPQRKVDLANELLEQSKQTNERAKRLLASVKPNQIVDVDSWDPRLAIGCVVRLEGKRVVLRDQDHLKECIEKGAEFICERPEVG